MDALVSILIPAYNAEKWIEQTIRSAMEQTWKRKEVIIVDDGSRDRTLRIARALESPMVKVVSQENAGGPAARNRALSIAQGDFIQYLDHDDLLDQSKIELQLMGGGIERNSRVLLASEFGLFYRRKEKSMVCPGPLWRDLSPEEYFLTKFTSNTWLHPSVFLISRRLIELAGPWLEIRSPDDDGEYFCRVVAACEKIKFIWGARSYWRIGNYSSMSNKRSNEALEGLFLTNRKCIDHFLRIENSVRSRLACAKFLENRLDRFMPERPDLVEATQELGKRLGYKIGLPKVPIRYRMIERFFGLGAVYKLRRKLRRLRSSVSNVV